MNLPTATLVILAGIVWVLQPVPAPSLTFEQRWEPVQEIPKPRELTFEERWEPVRQLPRMLPEGNLQPRMEPRIIPVRTITIRREDVVPAVHVETSSSQPDETRKGLSGYASPTQAVRDLPEAGSVRNAATGKPEARKARHFIRHASLDICQRHGMHKQITRGGKSWRCRR